MLPSTIICINFLAACFRNEARLAPYHGGSSSDAVCYYIIIDAIIGHIPDDKGPTLILSFTHWESEPAEVCVAFTPISHSADHSACAKARPLMTPHNSSKTPLKIQFFVLMCCQERRPREFAACQLRVLRGRVTFGEERGEKVEGRAKKAACLNLSKQRCCVAFFSLSIVSKCLGRREVLAFFALLLSCGQQNGLLGNLSGQGEDSLSSIKCHSISFTGVYFLFICRTRDMDTSFFLSGSPLVPPTACLLSVVPCFVILIHILLVCLYDENRRYLYVGTNKQKTTQEQNGECHHQ